jgi:hypothetical protein
MRHHGCCFCFFYLKRIIVLAAEVKMDAQILVGGLSGIDTAFSGVPLVVENCQCRATIFRYVWFYLELVLEIYLTHMVAFISPG